MTVLPVTVIISGGTFSARRFALLVAVAARCPDHEAVIGQSSLQGPARCAAGDQCRVLVRTGAIHAGPATQPRPAAQQSAPAADPASPGAAVGGAASAQPPAPWWGLTVDSIDNLDSTVAAIAALPVPPVVRLVFDVGEDPASYRSAVTRLSEHADVMALVVDSSDFASLTVD